MIFTMNISDTDFQEVEQIVGNGNQWLENNLNSLIKQCKDIVIQNKISKLTESEKISALITAADAKV